MVGLVPMRRSHSSIEDDDEDVDSPEVTDDEGPTQAGARKRARLTPEEGESRRTTGDSWHLETPQTVRKSQHQRPRARSSASRGLQKPQEHQPGAIVRVTLHDFVTYSNATFYPGPSLNMVIGPNGTGKSTLVCAICLGLGWAPKHLGRAKDVVEFIKHGCSKAIIEIELRGNPGHTNVVIKRQIDHQKSGNHWWVNEQASNEKHAKAAAESFNIQIDNLCQFLPQDRVAEFANLKPVDKLAATIRAAAPAEMTEQHEELKRLRGQQSTAETSLSQQKASLKDLESKHERQRGDVEKIREREQVTTERDLLEKQKTISQYEAAKKRHESTGRDWADAKTELQGMEEEVEPSTRGIAEKEEYHRRVVVVVAERKKMLDRAAQQVDHIHKESESIEAKAKNCEIKRVAEYKSRKQLMKDIAVVRDEIREIKKLRENAPPSFDGAAFNERSRERYREVVKVTTTLNNLEALHASAIDELKPKKQQIAQAERDKTGLSSLDGQREELLKSAVTYGSEIVDAWHLVQDLQKPGRQSPFKDKIYGPPLLECSVTDPSWANAVESLVKFQDMLALTCTNAHDFNELGRVIHKEAKYGNVSFRTQSAPLSQYTAPLETQEMSRLGITGWALDHLTGPDAVLAMICSNGQAHRTALLDRDESQAENAELGHRLSQWMTRSKSTAIKRRQEYGASSTTTRQIGPAKFWVKKAVDATAVNDLNANIAGWTGELGSIEKRCHDTSTKMKEANKQIDELKKEQKAIESEKNELQRKVSKFQGLPKKQETKEAQLDGKEIEAKEQLDTINAVSQEIGEHLLSRASCAIKHANAVASLRHLHVQAVEATIASLEAQSDVAALKAKNADMLRRLESKRLAVRDLQQQCEQLKTAAREWHRTARKLVLDFPAFQGWMTELSEGDRNRTPEQLDSLIDGLTARLDVLQGGTANTIKEYEKREEDIAALKVRIDEHDANMRQLVETITIIRTDWEPKLDAIIGQISDAFGNFFNKIKCAGEVSVHKAGPEGNDYAEGRDDDFENWSIKLKVKFREHEELSILDSHRQSGGERAVSTMFYLMSLQRLSRAPFRVVDEINQGMDPRNERVVHGLMVDIACGEAQDADGEVDDSLAPPGGSQYFLITPKLLTNLKYSGNMKVHCIASGEYMPEDPMKLDLKSLIAKAVKARQGGVGSMDRDPFGSASRSVSVGA